MESSLSPVFWLFQAPPAAANPIVPPADVAGIVLAEWWQVFLDAIVGSVAVDVVAVLAIYRANRGFPPEFGKKGYWAVRVILGLIGGVLAIALGARTPILAFQVGATAPALIERFAQAPPTTE